MAIEQGWHWISLCVDGSDVDAHHEPGRAEATLLEARVLVEDWRIEYNTLRPHSALGYLTPTDYAKAWTNTHPALS